jgi:hypothetical protein
MATLEERIQNLTQDINPMGAMSDMDREIAMNAMPRQQSATIMDMVGKTNGAISNREMEMFRNASPSMGTTVVVWVLYLTERWKFLETLCLMQLELTNLYLVAFQTQ